MAGPDPSKVYLRSIVYAGSGSPQGTVDASLSDDRGALSLIFDAFVAAAGPGVPSIEARKHSQVELDLRHPARWRYAVETVDFRGHLQLANGGSAELRLTAGFKGQPAAAAADARLSGPFARDFVARETIAPSSLVWAPGGEVVPLIVNLQARVSAGASGQPAMLTTDSIDGALRVILGLQWRRP